MFFLKSNGWKFPIQPFSSVQSPGACHRTVAQDQLISYQLITATSLAAGARTAFWHTRSDFISARSRRHRCSTWNSRRDRRARRKERPVDAPRLGTRHAIQQDGLRDTQLHLQGAARRRLCSACSRAMHRGPVASCQKGLIIGLSQESALVGPVTYHERHLDFVGRTAPRRREPRAARARAHAANPSDISATCDMSECSIFQRRAI
jgi:hypothetical protein